MNNAMNGTRKVPHIPVMEIFGPTIQGEGLMAGTVTHFLRTGGCGLRCSWCDTMFAVDPKQVRAGRKIMTADAIVQAISSRPHAPWLTLTGGDPCLQKHLGDIIYPLNMAKIQIAVETQGQLFPEWLKKCDVITFSPKPPSSGNVVDYVAMVVNMTKMFGLRIKERRVQICVKVVVFDEEDYNYALEVLDALPYSLYDSFYLTAGTKQYSDMPTTKEERAERAIDKIFSVTDAQRSLAERMLLDASLFNEKVHLGCQQHVLIWPEHEQGK
jgi:7-carboxy-7-deazaguanine synthase